jgi:uncharacterized iron-regulated membrane protein
MPPTRTPAGDERRLTAERARRDRAGRVARLRRQVLATALGTFVLAFAVIAFDGSMGSTTNGSVATPAPASDPPAATSAAQPAQDDHSAGDDVPAADGGASSPSPASSTDPLTTSQS